MYTLAESEREGEGKGESVALESPFALLKMSRALATLFKWMQIERRM